MRSAAAALVLALASFCSAQPVEHHPIDVIPQIRTRHLERWPVQLQRADAKVTINDQVATTTLVLTLFNPSRSPMEARVTLPVPDGITLRSMAYDGVGPEPTATLLPRDKARDIYNSIVNRYKDPALLEFLSSTLIQTSAFPIPANSSQNVTIVYEQVLPADAGRVDYILPRSESIESSNTEWRLEVSIKSQSPVASIYSPSHEVQIERKSDNEARVSLTSSAAAQPGSFRLAFTTRANKNEPSLTVFTYPDYSAPDSGGYFMLMAQLPELDAKRERVNREVTLVIDRSGSMRGEKMEQARQAALQIIEGLRPGESFNIIDYSDSVESFKPAPVVKDDDTARAAKAYIAKLEANGGTNIYDALLTALRPGPTQPLPLVLFLTDGLPTVGERSEVAIRNAAQKANTANRRIFSFGVGLDVNSPLLTAISTTSRAAPTFVLPKEDVEVKVSQVFRRLDGPVMEAPALAASETAETRIRELQPGKLMDVFEGDQVVVLGRYVGERPFRLELAGNSFGREQKFAINVDPAAGGMKHSFVPRLWATRKIGALIDAVRQSGADGGNPNDPKTKELVDEIVRLSTKFGVLTEYTAFLAVEPGEKHHFGLPADSAVNLGGLPAAREEAAKRITTRNKDRSGGGGVNQELNSRELTDRLTPAEGGGRQVIIDEDLNRVEVGGVQFMNEHTLIRRGERWVESTLIEHENEPPQRTIKFGTDEFEKIMPALAKENKQGLLARGGKVYLMLENQRTLIDLGE
ncbi:MAG: VWA domain-containing protein [Phycisphaerales bacterium]|nr:VWA domain-containing protein [Phycisphaerales bacterium]